MKFTLSWLKEHLETTASLAEIVEAMTMAGLEVESVEDPAATLGAFTVARIVESRRHPNADRLSVCLVDTTDGRKEIVCGAPNARTGLVTVYAPIGTYIPGTGITLEPRPVRGVVSNGMLCSAAELETAEESDGILELDGAWEVGAPAAEALGLEATIDFEVTPNRPDWLGVRGIARDLAAASIGKLKPDPVKATPGAFPCPIDIRLPAPEACPAFAGRLIRGLKNGPSPEWLQARLRAVGLRPINVLVDVTNFITRDRARPLHVYDAALLKGAFVEARLGMAGEEIAALDGKTYQASPETCVIADDSGAIGLGGVMGGASTGCSETTTEVFIESAWFDPILTAQTGRTLGIVSDAQYRFARGVDPASLLPGIEQATAMILELCGGEASEAVLAGTPPDVRPAFAFDPAYVAHLSGLTVSDKRVWEILQSLGIERTGGLVQPPSWRPDVEGKADLVEEVARIVGYGALPSTALPETPRAAGGVLTPRQARIRAARREMAAAGYQETITWSFMAGDKAALFGGGERSLVLENPIAADLDCMRPSILPNLIEAVGRNQRRGLFDVTLFEIGPVFFGDTGADQLTSIAAVLAPAGGKRWDGSRSDDLFTLKADLLSVLEEAGAPVANLQTAQGDAPGEWRPGRFARLTLGKTAVAAFGEVHPRVLAALDAEGPVYAFEAWIEAIPEGRRKTVKTKPAVKLSPFMPLTRDFAFVVARETPAEALTRAVVGADRALIARARVFDVFEGKGVAAGEKSVAVEVTIQPVERTLNDKDLEAVSGKIVAAAAKAVGARLRT
ncbi:MAG TPA: phenylalanine--tRNA ligase subunit beta [Caulobacteraceae bacterium]|jgi:phenylalanyl-tRNA synthetase beta chain